MGDFGHGYANMGGAHIDTWGAGPFVIRVAGKRYWFEDSDMFGPLLTSKNGRILDRQPGEKNPFWAAYTMWRQSGRPCKRGFVCRWVKPRPGQYWKDERGISHFLRDPDIEKLGYVQVPAPPPKPQETP